MYFAAMKQWNTDRRKQQMFTSPCVYKCRQARAYLIKVFQPWTVVDALSLWGKATLWPSTLWHDMNSAAINLLLLVVPVKMTHLDLHGLEKTSVSVFNRQRLPKSPFPWHCESSVFPYFPCYKEFCMKVFSVPYWSNFSFFWSLSILAIAPVFMRHGHFKCTFGHCKARCLGCIGLHTFT